ncbi:hypothetical protein ASPCADRAFT_7947 [Aspergillus carbonarius ITEM 5010]|uniref:Uncharacterized protein n=1 Tax=Aspergillus carbonarius (strain ITEM 5010) TaxID=602072 RepID=A0A1R3REV9_ASPC5|nr:hypothetical protein ASPCADRAFT_7947 [Aspergillus carbonarius ITEM 5010]
MAFLLRFFSECSSSLIDVCSDPLPHLKQHAVALSQMSSLVCYSACALAAKQLGQMKDPVKPQWTHGQSLLYRSLVDSNLSFLCYGTKYYEKAMQLLVKPPSHSHSTSQPSTSCLSQTDQIDGSATEFRLLALCLLSQYEELSASFSTWTGHLNSIDKILQPVLKGTITLETSIFITYPANSLESIFWYFTVHDVINACTSVSIPTYPQKCLTPYFNIPVISQTPPRLDTQDFILWRKMGLPLTTNGQLELEVLIQPRSEEILFKALIRLLFLLLHTNLTDPLQWTLLNEQFNSWYNILPTTFHCPIPWPSSE